MMEGGPENPLGARALYLGNTLYRIHGTNDPKSIGHAASSGCFRMMNQHVMHLAGLANVGTQVTVVHQLPTQSVAARSSTPRAAAEPEEEPPYIADPEEDFYGNEPRYERRYDRPERYNPYGRYDRWNDPL